jgi:hypothetical protein
MIKRILCLFIALSFLSSCGTIVMRMEGRMDRRPIEVKSKFYLWGLVGERSLIVKDYCSKGASRIEEEFTAGDVIVTALTFGIYAPRHSRFYCKL